MTALQRLLEKVHAGYKVRFREDTHGSTYAICYPGSPIYPRFLLRLRRGVRLSSTEAAVIKAELRRSAARAQRLQTTEV
jgi:hypothetical protein